MNIAAFTGSHTISSRRFRVLQYLDFLKKRGIEVDEFIANYGSWPPIEGWKRPIWLILTFLDRIRPVIRSRAYDLTLLQRELISTLFTLERFAGRPLIIDVDDAVWLSSERSRKNFLKLIRSADGIICGNSYIYESLADFNSNRVILPTAVDTRRFNVNRSNNDNKRKIIGWSGLAAGSKYLLGIETPLMQILENDSNSVLRVVSDSIPDFRFLKPHMFEYIKWTPENEVSTIQEMDIGLMPIDNSEWSKGKCSYKMLLYMSCGIPVVVSPYGMNSEVLSHAFCGYGAQTEVEWFDAIRHLLDNDLERICLGDNGRRVVEEYYSLDVLAPRLASYLLSFLGDA